MHFNVSHRFIELVIASKTEVVQCLLVSLQVVVDLEPLIELLERAKLTQER